MSNTELTLSIIERILIFSWLMKDLGWMTTNIYLGYPFGIIAIISHIYLFIIEPRTSFRFYDLSLVSWVIGNFLWMTIELFSGNPSSGILIFYIIVLFIILTIFVIFYRYSFWTCSTYRWYVRSVCRTINNH